MSPPVNTRYNSLVLMLYTGTSRPSVSMWLVLAPSISSIRNKTGGRDFYKVIRSISPLEHPSAQRDGGARAQGHNQADRRGSIVSLSLSLSLSGDSRLPHSWGLHLGPPIGLHSMGSWLLVGARFHPTGQRATCSCYLVVIPNLWTRSCSSSSAKPSGATEP